MKRVAQKGFTLIELLVGLLIVGALLTAALRGLAHRSEQFLVDRSVSSYAGDFAVLDRAVRSYMAAEASSWADNTRVPIPIATLIAADLLPAAFATRVTGAGTTPFGNTYAISGYKPAGQVPRAVVYETGNVQPIMQDRMNLLASGAGLRGVKQRIGENLSLRGLVGAAFISAGSLVANAAGGNGWQKDLAAIIPAAPTEHAAALLVGFPDLEPGGGGGGPPPGGVTIDRCQIVKSNCGSNHLCVGTSAVFTQATCPAGTTQAGAWPHCNTSNNIAYGVPALQEAMVLGSRRYETFPPPIDCPDYAFRNTGLTHNDACPTSSAPNCAAWTSWHDRCWNSFRTYETDQQHRLGGTVITGDHMCRFESYFYNPPGAREPSQSNQAWTRTSATDLICCEG